jgi:hypothetical protein
MACLALALESVTAPQPGPDLDADGDLFEQMGELRRADVTARARANTCNATRRRLAKDIVLGTNI